MPPQPQWFQHLPSALEQLRAFPAPVLDRAAIEKLLQISRRSAIRVMNGFEGFQAGRTFLILREDLLRALEAVQAGEAFERESRRRARLSDELDSVRRTLRSRQVKLPVPEEPSPTSLPAGIRLPRPGVLEVEFASAEELLGRLFALVQIASEDFMALEEMLAGQLPKKK